MRTRKREKGKRVRSSTDFRRSFHRSDAASGTRSVKAKFNECAHCSPSICERNVSIGLDSKFRRCVKAKKTLPSISFAKSLEHARFSSRQATLTQTSRLIIRVAVQCSSAGARLAFLRRNSFAHSKAWPLGARRSSCLRMPSCR